MSKPKWIPAVLGAVFGIAILSQLARLKPRKRAAVATNARTWADEWHSVAVDMPRALSLMEIRAMYRPLDAVLMIGVDNEFGQTLEFRMFLNTNKTVLHLRHKLGGVVASVDLNTDMPHVPEDCRIASAVERMVLLHVMPLRPEVD